MLTKRDLLRSTAAIAAGAAIARPSLLMAQRYPGIIEAKDIAEAGFIYGLPLVMNYGIMYEYAIDHNSGQFKAPFNQIKNEPNVFTYKDTAIVTPNSDTPYSFVWLDLRTEPVVLSVPAANRDPAHFPDADTFVIDRAENRHSAFGLGIHRCLGSNLARMELTVAIEEFLLRYPDFELSDPDAVAWSAGQVRGPRRIPIRIN